MKRFENRHIAILGMGISGKAAAHYLQREGAYVYCIDKNADKLRKENPTFLFYSETEEIPWQKMDFLVKSPGIASTHPLLQNLKIPLKSEIELACLHLYDAGKTLLAVTGSNGKTTTTLLATHAFQRCGKKTVAAGNVGVSFLSLIDSDADVFVVELSSFQIEMLNVPVFDAAVILNITANHLDRYGSMTEYAMAKFSIEHSLKKTAPLYVEKKAFEEFGNLLKTRSAFSLPPLQEKVETIFSLGYRDGGFSISAAHDLENFRAVCALGRHVGLSEKDLLQGIADFCKPPHRIEVVGSFNGVTFINDSKATSVDAVLKAIEAIQGRILLICGGVDKGGDFKEWKHPFLKKVAKVFAIGQAAKRIETELLPDISVIRVDQLHLAFQNACKEAEKGDTILLSPGCSSYDQFKDYEERGNLFKKLVFEIGGKLS